MINEVDNKTRDLYKMSDLEFDKNSVEMMRYRANSFPYIFGLLGLVFSVLAAFICLNSMMPNTILVLFKVLLNIVILLGGFLCCEKVKSYSIGGSKFMFVLGGLCFARIFMVPLILIYNQNLYDAAIKAGDADKADEIATNNISQVIIGEHKAGLVTAWLRIGAYGRAVVGIVLLVIATGCFVTSGIFGLQRSKKLKTYLESINASK